MGFRSRRLILIQVAGEIEDLNSNQEYLEQLRNHLALVLNLGNQVAVLVLGFLHYAEEVREERH
jgi:hypothetical protein